MRVIEIYKQVNYIGCYLSSFLSYINDTLFAKYN